jgi:UDP-N-acetylmuramate dehydrogenase
MNLELQALRQALSESVGADRLLTDEPLARYCNWKVGGPADLLFTARSSAELVQALRWAQKFSQAYTVIGFGANALVSDRGVRGLVVLNRAERIEFRDHCLVEADSGTNLAVLARRAMEKGVGGLEFLIGIPGTVGAAVAGNAGTRTYWISEVVERVSVLSPDGTIRQYGPAELAFSYRSSRLKHSSEVVISATLRGKPDDPAVIAHRMDELLQLRKNQPPGSSAGSVFKNPPGDFAGRLIEACGLKGHRIGGAKISEMHANFIVNTGGARAEDIKALIELAKVEVQRQFGVVLEEEIRYLGDWS